MYEWVYQLKSVVYIFYMGIFSDFNLYIGDFLGWYHYGNFFVICRNDFKEMLACLKYVYVVSQISDGGIFTGGSEELPLFNP